MLKRNKDWLIVSGLILLSLIPVIAGFSRIAKVSLGDSSLENSRFLLSPIPIVFHIVSASIYSLLGAIQFASSLRLRWPRWHRRMGQVLVGLGLIVALTGLWMTLFYPAANDDGLVVFAARLLVGVLMIFFIALGIIALLRRNYFKHGHWMLRAYAIAMGAGTQVLTHLPMLVFPSLQGETSRSIFMTLGWVINLAIAEWIILRSDRARALSETAHSIRLFIA